MEQADKNVVELLIRAEGVIASFLQMHDRYDLRGAELIAVAQLIQREEIRLSDKHRTIGPDGRWTIKTK